MNLSNPFKRQPQDYLDLTPNSNTSPTITNYVGLPISTIQLPKIQSRMNKIAAVNMIIPFTAFPITSPLLVWIGRRLGMKEKVKLQW